MAGLMIVDKGLEQCEAIVVIDRVAEEEVDVVAWDNGGIQHTLLNVVA